MVAIVVHEMISVATELITQLLDDTSHLLVRKVGAADLDALPELELIAQLVVIPRWDLEYPRKRKWMSAVCEFGAKGFYAGVKYAQADWGGVLVDPVLQMQGYIYRCAMSAWATGVSKLTIS